MRRRKYREWRNSAWERKWLQRELDASGMILNGVPRRPVLPPSTTTAITFEQAAARTPRPARRPARRTEATVFN